MKESKKKCGRIEKSDIISEEALSIVGDFASVLRDINELEKALHLKELSLEQKNTIMISIDNLCDKLKTIV